MPRIDVEEAFSEKSVRCGKWKYIPANSDGEPGRLYNIDADVAEKRNVAGRHPDVVDEMARLLTRLLENGCRDVQREDSRA